MTNGFEVLTAIATTIIALAIIVFIAIAVPFALELKRTSKKIDDLLGRVDSDFSPMMQRVREIGDNLGAITASVRTDIDAMSITVNAANDAVRDALVQAEDRLNDFNALLAVIQDEAEGLFVSTASAIRGVRGGAAAFGRRGGTDLASEELDAADPADDLDTQEEEGDGHDDDSESAAHPRAEAPRIRPRARGRRRA